MKHLGIYIKKEKKFQYFETGKGEVLLLLHGLFGTLSNFKDIIKYFPEKYRVVIPILPIYELPLLKANVPGLVSYVHDFIKFKAYDSVTLLGNSLGGHVALLYVLNYPEMVKSLILTGSSGLYENAMGDSFPKRNNYDYIKEKVEFTFFDPKTATKELIDECYETVNNRGKAIRIISMAKSAIKQNLAKEIHKINVKSCLIWGKNDNITPTHVAEEFKRLLPNSELHFIDKCGHAPMMEQPEKFNRILEDFLDRLETEIKV